MKIHAIALIKSWMPIIRNWSNSEELKTHEKYLKQNAYEKKNVLNIILANYLHILTEKDE